MMSSTTSTVCWLPYNSRIQTHPYWEWAVSLPGWVPLGCYKSTRHLAIKVRMRPAKELLIFNYALVLKLTTIMKRGSRTTTTQSITPWLLEESHNLTKPLCQEYSLGTTMNQTKQELDSSAESHYLPRFSVSALVPLCLDRLYSPLARVGSLEGWSQMRNSWTALFHADWVRTFKQNSRLYLRSTMRRPNTTWTSVLTSWFKSWDLTLTSHSRSVLTAAFLIQVPRVSKITKYPKDSTIKQASIALWVTRQVTDLPPTAAGGFQTFSGAYPLWTKLTALL